MTIRLCNGCGAPLCYPNGRPHPATTTRCRDCVLSMKGIVKEIAAPRACARSGCKGTFRRDVRGNTRYCSQACWPSTYVPAVRGTKRSLCAYVNCRKPFLRLIGVKGRPKVYHTYKCEQAAGTRRRRRLRKERLSV